MTLNTLVNIPHSDLVELEISELVTEYHDAYDFAYLAKVLVLSFAQCPHRIFSSEKINKN